MRIAIAAALGAGAVAGTLALAACSSANGGTGSVAAGSPSTPVSSAAPSSVPATASSLVPSAVPPSSAASSTPSSSAASSAASTPVTSPATSTRPPRPAQSTPPASGPSNCTSAQLSVDGVRGGAQQGVETAGVIFTNTSDRTCALQGYPFAQLRYKGKPLGKPATNDPGQVRIVVLRPGHAAQSLLHAVTTCQAPLSDRVRTQAPGTDTPVDVELQLRGCSLSIDPLEAG